MTVAQPYERIPLWHRVGGLMIMAAAPGLRVDRQDWSELVLEAFPDSSAIASVTRTLRARGDGEDVTAATHVTMTTDGRGGVAVTVSAAEDVEARAWVLRLHLRPQQRVVGASVDGTEITDSVQHLKPVGVVDAFFPFGGKGASPAPLAGAVAEIHLGVSAKPRRVRVQVE
jgi:hypothetical protein